MSLVPIIIKRPLNPDDVDISKISFSPVKQNHFSQLKYVDLKYNGEQFLFVARNCNIIFIFPNGKMIIEITDKKFIKMISSIINKYIFSEIRPDCAKSYAEFSKSYAEFYASHPEFAPSRHPEDKNEKFMLCKPSIQYVKSNDYSTDCLLFKNKKNVDICFSINEVYLHKANCINIEKIKEIK